MTTTLNPYRITEMDPAEWTVLGYFYQGSSEEMAEVYCDDARELEAALEALGMDWSAIQFHAKNGGCAHCGARFNHGAVVRNSKTNACIAIGHTCAEERFNLKTKAELTDKYGAVKLNRERQLAAQKFAQLLVANPGLEDALETPHHIVRDIRWQAAKRGDLSDRQLALVFKLHREHLQRLADELAARDGVPAEPCPAGRVVITGKIVYTKWQDSDYYPATLKMLVLDDRGFKVWGTMPSKIDASKGDRVTFTASVEKKQGDDFFGFYKRPAKASVIDQPAVEADEVTTNEAGEEY